MHVHVHVHITSLFDILTVTSTLCTGVGYVAFSQGTSSATAGVPSSVSYSAQVQHPTPLSVHSGWSVLLCIASHSS